MAVNNIISFSSPKQDDQGQMNNKAFSKNESHAIMSACRVILATSLPTYFCFFENLDNSLFKLAEQAPSNRHQEEFFAVMREFRLKQEDIKKQFTDLILADFDSMLGPSSASLKSESKETSSLLSLMDNDVLEEDIALKKINTKAEDTCRYDINQLDKRFSALLKKDLQQNIFSLSRIIDHLKTVISAITNDITIKLITYKHFEQESIDQLHSTFQLLNEELIKQGILPELKLSNKKSPSSTTSSKHSSADDSVENNDNPAIFEELRQLLGNNVAGTAASTIPVLPAGGEATLSTLVSVLSNLQAKPELQPSYNESGTLVLPDLRQSLQSNLEQSQQSVSRVDEDTINVISFLFEFILEDLAIPSPIRALLARLQLPMLKVAITDKSFFSQKNHSARRLLNNLAKISTGWEHKTGSDDTLFNLIESIVNTVLSDFDDDITIFDALNEQLNLFTQQQQQTSTAAEQLLTTTSAGQEKLIASKQYVDTLINKVLSKYTPVPKAAMTLINEDWRKILNLRLLQKGLDSTEWKQAVELMDQLLWSVSPKTTEEERKQLLTTIPTLLKSLRSNLSGASFNQHKITTTFKALQACHIKCLSGDKLNESELQNVTPEVQTALPQQDEISSSPQDTQLHDHALTKAKELTIGTWLEITGKEDEHRIKFSWRSNLTGQCLFVNYQGLKVAEYSLAELAELFQQDQAIIIDVSKSPLMDRALISMKETIEQQGATVTS